MKVKSESEVAQSCPTPSDSMDRRLLRPWDFPGKSAGVGASAFSGRPRGVTATQNRLSTPTVSQLSSSPPVPLEQS